MNQRIRTHYQDCYKNHHDCAVAKLEQIEQIRTELNKIAEEVEAAFRHGTRQELETALSKYQAKVKEL